MQEAKAGEECVQARRSAAYPQAQVGSGGGEEQIHGVALEAAQEVAAESEVAF